MTVADLLAREGRTYTGPYSFTPTITTDNDPQDHGFICKHCGGPQPIGIGYVLDGHDAYLASAAMTAPCDCTTR